MSTTSALVDTVTETVSNIQASASSPKQMRYRSLQQARDAYSSAADEDVRRERSREAHGLLAPATEPGSPQIKSTWSPFVEAAEAGHNEELAHRGTTLVLRGAVNGIVLATFVTSLGDAAGWPAPLTAKLSATVLLCWAAYAGCNEALEAVTYAAYYERERQREAWGARARVVGIKTLSAAPGDALPAFVYLPFSLLSLACLLAELDNFPEGEVEEMVQLYTKRGLPEHSARSIITAMASSPQFFVDVMMLEELQMSPPPALTALSAASRVAGGMLACGGSLLVSSVMLDRALSEPPHRGASSSFLGCSTPYLVLLGLAMLALSYLGWLRASITHQEKRKLALQTCACVLPCVLLARAMGGLLLADALITV